jgi:hypothetical protein
LVKAFIIFLVFSLTFPRFRYSFPASQTCCYSAFKLSQLLGLFPVFFLAKLFPDLLHLITVFCLYLLYFVCTYCTPSWSTVLGLGLLYFFLFSLCLAGTRPMSCQACKSSRLSMSVPTVLCLYLLYLVCTYCTRSWSTVFFSIYSLPSRHSTHELSGL